VALRQAPDDWAVPPDSFFQNNFHALPRLVEAVRQCLRDAGSRHLVDVYCGVGFFAIELGDLVESFAGVEIDTPAVKAALGRLSPSAVTASTLAGDPITAILTTAPGNGAPIGGLKVVSTEGWFAARPSGTENVTKLYAESFRGEEHLGRILEEAQSLVAATVAGGGA
jgi:hypothetical protein